MTTTLTRTLREFRQARTGGTLVALSLGMGFYRVATVDVSVNSLLIVAVVFALFGAALLLRSGRHI